MRVEGTILINYVNKIKDIINWYKNCTHKITIAYLCSGVRQFLRSLTFLYPLEIRSTVQSLDFSDENLFKTYLPIRDWGKMGDLLNVNANFHIPNETELRIAIDFVQSYVDLSINRLAEKSTEMHKDERFRVLSFIYNLLVGSARLLRRPNRPIVDEQ